MAPQAGVPRAPRDGDRSQEVGADDHMKRALAAEHYAPYREREPPLRKSAGRASRRRKRGGTTEPVPGAPARSRRQGCRERRATAIDPMRKAPTTTRREREPPSTTHRTERASRRCIRATTERHAVVSAAARPSQR